MLLQATISLTVIAILTIVMSVLLARVVKQINAESREYFEKKIVVYDELINEKEKTLDTIKEEIADIEAREHEVVEGKDEKANNLIVVNEKLPEYKIEGFLKKAKLVDDEFKLNKDETVRKFIDERVNKGGDGASMESLAQLYGKIKNDRSYESIARSAEDGWAFVTNLLDDNTRRILEPYMAGSPNADINEILGFVRLELDKLSPEIKIETGNKDDNFGYISDKIKTVYNPEIYMGIRIFYQDRMYDYSLRGVA